MPPNTLIFAALSMITVGGLFYAFVYPYLSGEMKAEKRKAAIQGIATRRVSDGGKDAAQRRKQIADSLKDLESRGKSKKVTLETKIGQAGLTWSKQKFFLISGGLALLVAVLLFYATGHLYSIALGLLIGGLGLPNWIISFLKKRRINKFINEFPNAVDVIIRGIKAGLPLGDCLRVIANEAQDPVKTEFRYIVEAQTIGLSAGEAVERLVERIPVAEANFFFDRHRHPAKIRRQLVGSAGQSVACAAGSQEDEAENQGDVERSQGIGRHHRFVAVYRHLARLSVESEIYRTFVDDVHGYHGARYRRLLDVSGRHGDAQDDQLRFLR